MIFIYDILIFLFFIFRFILQEFLAHMLAVVCLPSYGPNDDTSLCNLYSALNYKLLGIFELISGILVLLCIFASLYVVFGLFIRLCSAKHVQHKSLNLTQLSIGIAILIQNLFLACLLLGKLAWAIRLPFYEFYSTYLVPLQFFEATSSVLPEICILVDSLTTLFVMSGYRKSLFLFGKFVCAKIFGVNVQILL